MTFQQFLNKWDRKGINYDGAYGNQCVDVYDQYCKEVVGCRVILIPGAKDIWANYPTEAFVKIPNTPSGVPQKGDVMIWGTAVGTYGHVGIVISANVNSFTSFDQNWPFDNGTGVAHFQYHNYSGVLGWLRPKKDVNFDQAAYDAAQAALKAAADAKAKAEAEDKLKAEQAAKAEADRIQKEKAAQEAAEAKKLAEEQAKLEEELKEKQSAEQAITTAKSISLWDLIIRLINWLKGK